MPDTTPPPGAAADAARPSLAPPDLAAVQADGAAALRPHATPTSVQLVDRIGDVVAVIVFGLLCNGGKISGELCVFAVGAVLGVGTGLRQINPRATSSTGVGVVGLALLALAPLAAAVARSRGLATATLALALGGAVALTPPGCAPRLPPVAGCAPTAQRCGPSGTPEVCSASQRWEPAGDLPCAAVGAVCVESDGGLAHCAAARDGGADAE